MRRDRLILIVLLALGALLRFWDLSSIEFKYDEQEALNLGSRLLEERPWSTLGPWPQTGMLSSAGIANPPFFNWVMALFWAVTRDPIRATALVALANWLCLFPLYRWARHRLGTERSLIFLAALCASPFAVLYSRKLWAQDLMLPGLTLMLWGVHWMREQPTFWRGLACVIWAALPVSQLHQSGTIALAVALPAAFVQRWYDARWGRHTRIGRPAVTSIVAIVAGVGALLFFWLPYLGYVLSLPSEALANQPKVPMIRGELLRRVVFQLFPRDLLWFFGNDMKYFLGEEQYGSAALVLRLVGYHGAFATGTLAGLYGVYRWVVAPFSLAFFGIWWIGIIIVFTLARIPSYPHYVLILAPLPALLISGGFDPRHEPPWLQWIRWVRWAHVVSLCLLTTGILLWIGARGGSSGSYGVAYHVRLEQARAIAHGVPASDHVGSDLECGALNSELRWLLVHLVGASQRADGVQLCEAWLDRGTHREYAWALRR